MELAPFLVPGEGRARNQVLEGGGGSVFSLVSQYTFINACQDCAKHRGHKDRPARPCRGSSESSGGDKVRNHVMVPRQDKSEGKTRRKVLMLEGMGRASSRRQDCLRLEEVLARGRASRAWGTA